MTDFGIASLLPPVLAIILAIVTRQVIVSLFVGVWIGATMLHGFNPMAGLSSLFSDYLFKQLGDSWNASVIIMVTLCGMFSALIERGGGAFAFAQALENKVSTKKQGQLVTWLGGLFIFFSDSTNPVLVGPIFRPITDRLKISREKLAYIVDTTTAAVPALLPFTSWGAYTISIVAKEYEQIEYSGNPLVDFMAGVPFQYYSIACLILVPLIAISGLNFGPMRRAELRAETTGKVLSDTARPMRLPFPVEIPDGAKPSIWGIIVPILALLVSVFGMFLWTGGYPEKPVLEALGSASSLTSLNVAFFIAVIVAIIFAVKDRVFTVQQAIDTTFRGGGMMFEANFILVLAWSIGSVCKGVGTADYIVSIAKDLLTPSSMYVVVFIASCFTAFATGTSWGVFALFLPISIPLAQAIGAPMAPAIGIVLSGGIFGDHCSPISDTTVLSSMGSSCDHIDHVTTQLPYALVGALSALVGYIVAGFVSSALPGLAVTIALMFAIVFVIGKQQNKTNPA
jgi:Na+/H+ antiporter NhaC